LINMSICRSKCVTIEEKKICGSPQDECEWERKKLWSGRVWEKG
jgi:hypothetical protein